MVGVVAFDLDGTLLRGPTVCELLAEPLGRLAEMRRFEALSSEAEIAAARREMARWYEGRSAAQLCAALEAATWAPGAHEGVALLQSQGIEVVIASITWSFAVEWVAERLGVGRALGTKLEPDGRIADVWPRDKARWLERQLAELRVPSARAAAVGDSGSDGDLLAAASLRFFVGSGEPPPLAGLVHRPAGDIAQIAREVLDRWKA
jgi:HAD superfamily phosphoserine phosphatase-like hydrolase